MHRNVSDLPCYLDLDILLALVRQLNLVCLKMWQSDHCNRLEYGRGAHYFTGAQSSRTISDDFFNS